MFAPPPIGASKEGGGDIWTVNSKHTHTVQLPCKYYFISPSNKTSRKKAANYFFYALHYSASDLKSVIALNSRGTLPLCTGLVGHCPPCHPPCVRPWPWEIGLLHTKSKSSYIVIENALKSDIYHINIHCSFTLGYILISLFF